MSQGGASLVFYFSGDCAFRAMFPSLRALCVGRCRLFVVVFVFASEQAEEREADQRGEKAQAHQRGCGRRRGSEVEDGHHQRQRDDDFQEVGHGEGRVCCAARNTAAAIACLLVY